jgi:hypothetical protein
MHTITYFLSGSLSYPLLELILMSHLIPLWRGISLYIEPSSARDFVSHSTTELMPQYICE